MQVSYSRIDCYKKCPYLYKLRYLDRLDTLPSDDPANPLILGSALHKAIETDVQTAIEEYYKSYPVITDQHITEAMKLEYWLPKIKEVLPEGEHEVEIKNDDFIGFMDLLTPIDTLTTIDYDLNDNYEWFDLYDFKYANSLVNYESSKQLHVYKYFFEKLNPTKRINKMYFMLVPKCNLRIKYKNKTNPRDETLEEFRRRILDDLKTKEIEFLEVKYDPNKVIEFMEDVKHVVEADVFPKSETRLCDYCNFKQYCQEGIDYDIIRKG